MIFLKKSKVDGLSSFDFEENVEDNPLFDDKEDRACFSDFHDDLDARFQIVDYSMDMEYMEYFGDPIYDTYSDASIEKIVYLEPLEQPNINEDLRSHV